MKRVIKLETAINEIEKQFDFFGLEYEDMGIDDTHNFFVDDALVYRLEDDTLVYVGINNEDYMVGDNFTHKMVDVKYYIAQFASSIK